MSKYVKLYMESPQNVEVFIEDKDGNVVASIRMLRIHLSLMVKNILFLR